MLKLAYHRRRNTPLMMASHAILPAQRQQTQSSGIYLYQHPSDDETYTQVKVVG